MQVNGKVYPKNSTVPLNDGDEMVFGSSGDHAYVSFSPMYFLLFVEILYTCKKCAFHINVSNGRINGFLYLLF